MKYGIDSDLGQFSHKFSVIIGCFHPMMSIRCSSGLYLERLKFLLFELLLKTDLWNIPWFRGLNKALCAVCFLEGAAIGEKRLMSLSHPTSSPTVSHTSSHPVNSSLFWSHFSSWRRINCTSKRGSAPPHSDTCCDHRLCTFVLLLHFMLLRRRGCPTAICESGEKKNLV